MAARAELIQLLKELQIDHETVDHAPIFTVEEGRDHKTAMAGGHTKNLFLKDKKKNIYLVSAWCETQIDLVALSKLIGARGRFSFASPEAMVEILKVTPGSVTPFALMNDRETAIKTFVFDRRLLSFDRIWFHPMENNASTGVAPHGFLAFLSHIGVEPLMVDFEAHKFEG